MILCTANQFQGLFPRVRVDLYPNIVQFGEKYNIENPSMFLAQTSYESENYTVFEEDLYYSASALLRIWPNDFDVQTVDTYADQPEAIANVIYANRMGNGNSESDDGWKFRGRGLIQITGRDNYTNFGNHINKTPDEVVLYMGTIQGIVESACWYWRFGNRDLNGYKTASDLPVVTEYINGGYSGLYQRTQNFNRIYAILKV